MMLGDPNWTIKSISYRNPPTSSSCTIRLTPIIFETNRRHRSQRYLNSKNHWSQSPKNKNLSLTHWSQNLKNKKLSLKVYVKANPTFKAKGSHLPDKVKSLPHKVAHQFNNKCEERLQFLRNPNFTESNRCRMILLMSHMLPRKTKASLSTRSNLQILFRKIWQGSRLIQSPIIHFKKSRNEEGI